MLFYGSAARPEAAAALALVAANRRLFDDDKACFFGITSDPTDPGAGRIAQQIPGIRHFLDFDRKLGALYRTVGPAGFEPRWLVLDPALRVLGGFPIDAGEAAIALLRSEIAAVSDDGWAPVLQIPNVLSADTCAELVRRYEAQGGEESGFMRDVNGKTTLVLDPSHKQRRDWTIDDEALIKSLVGQLSAHLTTPIKRAFQFTPTRIERYIVACYEAGAGHFRPHRDNLTMGTAHRKFAVTINLNAGNYEGGDLRFPEFGQRTYRATTGGAVVFSCSLLHEATPVTSGKRYAFLPFLYDEEGAKIREANNRHLGEGIEPYKASAGTS
ncbi:2OG-Fe(II) oxygenase [Sphingomonas sabuli]|uniref:2OG-Fe(II) oxygenase n=2 Tax=Sphingomonas sabuli TaxID=2764186 RepID=A0A7G9L5M1_9SPHN|nr:2OG-Fe(II) oxygenase [Sphingomonas sabuli]